MSNEHYFPCYNLVSPAEIRIKIYKVKKQEEGLAMRHFLIQNRIKVGFCYDMLNLTITKEIRKTLRESEREGKREGERERERSV